MERNAVIYYSSNETPYVKRDGNVCVLGENFSINWKEEESEFCIKRENGKTFLSSTGSISYKINLSANETACEIYTPYGTTNVQVGKITLNCAVFENEDVFSILIKYSLFFANEEDKHVLSIRGKKL